MAFMLLQLSLRIIALTEVTTSRTTGTHILAHRHGVLNDDNGE